jgi:RimJ/RimL family protein N-acetyltransferase
VGLKRHGGGEMEIGYWIRSDRTGRGDASEATRLLTNAAFNSGLDITSVRVSMDRANAASAAVPRKLGFELDDEYDRDVVTPGHSRRAIAWVLARDDWRRRTP